MKISRIVYYYAICCMISIVACKDVEDKSEDEANLTIEEIKINIDSLKSVPVYDIIDSIQVMNLDSKDIQINNISKISFTRHKRIYVLDQIAQTINVFDSNGKFIMRINKNGMGNGEYKNITDFQIDRNSNTIGIIDALSRKFIKYDLQGNLIKEYTISNMKGVTKFSFLNNGDIAFSKGIPPEDKDKMFSLIITDKDLNFKDNYIKYANASSAVISAFYPFQQLGSEVFYLPVYNNRIYSINSASVKPVYKLDFGAKWISNDYVFKPIRTTTFQWIFDDLPKTEFVYFINYVILKTHLLVYYTYKSKNYLTVYDRTTKKAISTKLNNDYKTLGLTSSNSSIIENYYLSVAQFNSKLDFKDQKNSDLLKSSGSKMAFGNPVILLITLKKII